MTYRALLFDVMGTLVYEPFYEVVPSALGMTLEELLAVKHPSAWVDFELGLIDEAALRERFFADRRGFDFDGMKRAMIEAYQWLDGVEAIVAELAERGHELHVLSNYPLWYRLVEDKLAISRYVRWSFVSCHMGVRKPDPEAYRIPARELGAAPEQLLFVDDRRGNCEAAARVGLDAVRFEGALSLRSALVERGLL